MPLDRSQKLSWFVGLPLAIVAVAVIVLIQGGPAGPTEKRASTPRPPELRDQLERNLRAIYRGVRFHHLEHGELPAPSSEPTPPPDTCCDQLDRTCPPSPSQWEREPWPSIGFEVVDPDPYSYAYTLEPDGQRFTISATGEPDCDGDSIARRIEGAVVGGTLDPDPVILP